MKLVVNMYHGGNLLLSKEYDLIKDGDVFTTDTKIIMNWPSDDNVSKEVPIIERKHRWIHDDTPTDCSRNKEPIFTDPNVAPRPCGENKWRGGCGSDRWFSGGVVLRDKKTKKIIHEEK